jgi:hypothetical protein
MFLCPESAVARSYQQLNEGALESESSQLYSGVHEGVVAMDDLQDWLVLRHSSRRTNAAADGGHF